uniref:GIY-YIG domain-containing protein n=1 Tax=viral metagenome TaxID=1070528 RepID=A0A6C0JGM6_9ZZZZ
MESEQNLELETIVCDGRGPWYCYILRNKNPQYRHLTYNGSTNNPKRRLRQHNEEISGGARYTHGRGGGWEIYALLTGFPDHKNALSCEWRIKHTNGKPGKRPQEHCGMKGRVIALNDILKLEKWTKQCTVSNSKMNLTLYLTEDVLKYVDSTNLPENVTVVQGIPIEF